MAVLEMTRTRKPNSRIDAVNLFTGVLRSANNQLLSELIFQG